MAFDLDGYVPVADRITAWYDLHPDGRIVADPPTLVDLNGRFFVASTARAYRSPEDICPCQGSAWEPYPGPTPYTRDSEAQNAETSAVGRALALAGIEVKKGMASREEVQARQPASAPTVERSVVDALQSRLDALSPDLKERALEKASDAAEFAVMNVRETCKNETWVAWWDGLLTKAEAKQAELESPFVEGES